MIRNTLDLGAIEDLDARTCDVFAALGLALFNKIFTDARPRLGICERDILRLRTMVIDQVGIERQDVANLAVDVVVMLQSNTR